MKVTNVPISSDGASHQLPSGSPARRTAGKILLVGDISKAFLDAGSIINQQCEVRTNMLDAIDAAAKNDFAAIGIVMAGQAEGLDSSRRRLAEPERDRIKPAIGGSPKLSSALLALKKANPNAKIILLSQMYEEPIARQFVSPASNGTRVADDYLICPLQVNTFYSSVMSRKDTGDRRRATSDEVCGLEMRIKQLERLATTDDLTGLKNRRYIWEFCRQILEHAKRENGRVTLLIFDIDNFKHYNDVYGHSVGDKILTQAAILMRRCCRAHDVVGRIGGDEFAVVFWDTASAQSAEIRNLKPVPSTSSGQALSRAEGFDIRNFRRAGQDHPKEVIFIANRFREELEMADLSAYGGLGPKGEGVLTISGGLSSFPHDGSTVQELFQKADRALLEAKRSGKNRIYLVGKPPSDIADIE